MNTERPAGIIDTLSMGYGLINRRPWLLVIPIVLDLFFWFGPRLSIQQFMGAALDLIARQGSANVEMLERLRMESGQLNLFSLLLLGFQIPSLMRGLDPRRTPLLDRQPVIALDEPLALIVVTLGLLVAGLVLSVLYAVPIGQAVRGERARLAALGREAGLAALRLSALLIVLLGGGLMVVVPLSVAGALLAAVGLNLLPLIELVLSVGLLWLAIYLFFSVNAIIVSRSGPIRAISQSVAVVWHNFWSTLGLVLLTMVISAGLAAVFQLLGGMVAGLPLAIVAHAYIHTGLIAASMIFFRDRLARRPVPVARAH